MKKIILVVALVLFAGGCWKAADVADGADKANEFVEGSKGMVKVVAPLLGSYSDAAVGGLSILSSILLLVGQTARKQAKKAKAVTQTVMKGVDKFGKIGVAINGQAIKDGTLDDTKAAYLELAAAGKVTTDS